MEKVMVIGSNSFSGAYFVDFCLAKGMTVVGISRSVEPLSVFLPYRNNPGIANFTFCQCDLNHDLDRIMDIVQSFRPDYVVNFAAQGMVSQSWNAPEQWFMTNTVSAVRFHDRLRRCPFLKKFVQISTPEVYGSCSGNIKESFNYSPSTPYAVSKAATDMSLRTFLNTYGFPVVFTRSANVYGPCQSLYRIIPAAILNFMTGQKLMLHGGGVSVRSFIHVRDVADGTFRVMKDGCPGDVFHFSTDRMISILDLVRLIAGKVGVDFSESVVMAEERPGKDFSYSLDSSKARSEIGWHDNVSLEDGIDETIHWIKDNFETLKHLPRQYIHKE